MKALEFILDSVGCLFDDILVGVLVHTTEHHRHAPARMGKDEPDVLELRERAGNEQIGHCSRRVLRNFEHYGAYIRQQCATAQSRSRMHEHHRLAAIQFFENWFVSRMPQPFVVITGHEPDPIRIEHPECVFDLAQAPFCVREGYYREETEAARVTSAEIGGIFIHAACALRCLFIICDSLYQRRIGEGGTLAHCPTSDAALRRTSSGM